METFNLEEENIQQDFLFLPKARDRMAPLGLPGSSSSVVVSLKFVSSTFTVSLWVFLRCELCSCKAFVAVNEKKSITEFCSVTN